MTAKNLRDDSQQILNAALAAVDPYKAVQKALTLEDSLLKVGQNTIDLKEYDKIIVVGAGKAAAPMSKALEDILGKRLNKGLVVVKDGHVMPTDVVQVCESSHPVPDERGVKAGDRIAEILKENAGPKTIVFSVLSGGGSALLVSPADGITLEDKQKTTGLLLASGADIVQINTIRKHLSKLKGGGLARLAGSSKLISLIISDVVGDRLDSIASGPTVPDETTWQDCKDILDNYQIWDSVPKSVRNRIEDGLEGKILETLKPGEKGVSKSDNLIIANNRKALSHAQDKAIELGYRTLILASTIEGETKDIALAHASIAREIIENKKPVPAPCCIITGGETTVSLGDSTGKGGRNQEFALAVLKEIRGMKDVLLLSCGTDGTDGPTDAAGARADGHSYDKALQMGMLPNEYLRNHDSYHFFKKINDLIMTGPTMTNVMDIRLILVS